MASQPKKLYRSNINFMSVAVLPPKDSETTEDYQMQQKFKRQNSNRNTLASTSSQAHLKSKQLDQSIEITKQTMPYININDIHKKSFISIDEAYQNPKFQKKKEFALNRILPNNITDIQSDTQSLGSRSIRTYRGQDQYYKYWKSKAHEYLQENFKLRQENNKLKGEMEMMRQENKKQNKQTLLDKQDTQIRQRKDKSFACLQGIFKKKLDELERLLQQKTSKIISLEGQVLQLNRKLLGEQERTQLIERLGSQIDTLTHQNILLKVEISNMDSQSKSRQSIEKPSPELGLRYRYKSKEKIYGLGRKISIQKGNKR